MNKKYLIGIYQISKQNTYIVAHALYSYARKPVESESICFVLRLGGAQRAEPLLYNCFALKFDIYL